MANETLATRYEFEIRSDNETAIGYDMQDLDSEPAELQPLSGPVLTVLGTFGNFNEETGILSIIITDSEYDLDDDDPDSIISQISSLTADSVTAEWTGTYEPREDGDTDAEISIAPRAFDRCTAWVWGNGAQFEQALNEATAVRSYKELGSVTADLDQIAESISDNDYRAWFSTNRTHDDSPRKTVLAMARDLCEEFVLNTITGATGAVDITAEVLADMSEEVTA